MIRRHKKIFLLANLIMIGVVLRIFKHLSSENKVGFFQTSYVYSKMINIMGKQSRVKSTTGDPDIRAVLRELEEYIGETDFRHIFRGDVANKSTWEFEFSQISKRRFGRKYAELTTYDPDARNLDFFNPVGFDGNSMILFEDYGAGVVHRVLFYPGRYQNMSPTAENDVLIYIMVDGKVLLNANVYGTLQNCDCPFKHPFFRPQRKRVASGYYFTFPISYQRSIRISSIFTNISKLNETEIWRAMRYCKDKNSECPYKMYLGATYNKFAHGVKLKTTFQDYYQPDSLTLNKNILEEVNSAVSTMATTPEEYVPGMKSDCHLTCQNVPEGGEVAIFSSENTAEVIQSLLFRVYDPFRRKHIVSEHWDRMLLTMTWDGKASQVKDIPLAGIFTVGFGFIRNVNSLMAGMRKKTCTVNGEGISISDDGKLDWIAYLFYEMPFWKSARITVKRPRGFGPAVICTKVTTKQLDTAKYNPRLTGYFSAQLNQYDNDKPGHKTMLKVENEWGHVVGVNVFMERIAAYKSVEKDIIIEVDDAKAPVMSGTGFEDFFGYVHAFRMNLNRTGTLAGDSNYWRGRIGAPELVICHTYRHMVLDPILFTKGILMYLEDSCDRKGTKTSRARKWTAPSSDVFTFRPSLFFVAMFYGHKGSGGITTDYVNYGDPNSTDVHNVQYSPFNTERFEISSVFENQPGLVFTRWIVSMKVRQRVQHRFKIHGENAGVILRREYRSMVRNQKSKVLVDGEDAGTWFCPQGAETAGFSLRINDHHIHPRLTVGKDILEVTIEALTTWESSSIEIISVLLSS